MDDHGPKEAWASRTISLPLQILLFGVGGQMACSLLGPGPGHRILSRDIHPAQRMADGSCADVVTETRERHDPQMTGGVPYENISQETVVVSATAVACSGTTATGGMATLQESNGAQSPDAPTLGDQALRAISEQEESARRNQAALEALPAVAQRARDAVAAHDFEGARGVISAWETEFAGTDAIPAMTAVQRRVERAEASYRVLEEHDVALARRPRRMYLARDAVEPLGAVGAGLEEVPGSGPLPLGRALDVWARVADSALVSEGSDAESEAAPNLFSMLGWVPLQALTTRDPLAAQHRRENAARVRMQARGCIAIDRDAERARLRHNAANVDRIEASFYSAFHCQNAERISAELVAVGVVTALGTCSFDLGLRRFVAEATAGNIELPSSEESTELLAIDGALFAPAIRQFCRETDLREVTIQIDDDGDGRGDRTTTIPRYPFMQVSTNHSF